MGYTRWDPSAYATLSSSRSYGTKSVDDIFAKTVDPKMSARNIDQREARDSAANPLSTPIILALDGTGSMASVMKRAIASFNVMIENLIDRKPVTDPAIMTMVFDDVHYESGERVLQVSQFESDLRAVEQLEKMVPTRNGGGNDSESYHLPLYMAAFKTVTDAWDKRGKKGYLFIVGDEACPPPLTKEQIREAFGADESAASEDLSYDDLYAAASRKYEVFHVVAMQGSYAGARGTDKMRSIWSKHVGQNVIILTDIDKLPEVLVSVIQVREGADADSVASSWSGTTAVAVREATKTIAKRDDSAAGTGVVTV